MRYRHALREREKEKRTYRKFEFAGLEATCFGNRAGNIDPFLSPLSDISARISVRLPCPRFEARPGMIGQLYIEYERQRACEIDQNEAEADGRTYDTMT